MATRSPGRSIQQSLWQVSIYIPGLNRVTWLPVLMTMPALSWPNPFSPTTTISPIFPCFQKWTSEPQIPVARTCTRHSLGPGSGTSDSTRWSPCWGLVLTAILRGLRSRISVADDIFVVLVCGVHASPLQRDSNTYIFASVNYRTITRIFRVGWSPE